MWALHKKKFNWYFHLYLPLALIFYEFFFHCLSTHFFPPITICYHSTTLLSTWIINVVFMLNVPASHIIWPYLTEKVTVLTLQDVLSALSVKYISCLCLTTLKFKTLWTHGIFSINNFSLRNRKGEIKH